MYDAFISYRHSELDRFVAENLHRKLEAFRLPKSVIKQRGENCKKRIERVFRDRDELPLASSLADPIVKALSQSEFLIVICSPRLRESLWCKKEIDTFIKLHGHDKILAVLVEGEPEESFPEELLYREKQVLNEDGSSTIIKEQVEPLAADVRGENKKEILKAINQEILRLAAAMFQCNYDDLKQRHKEQKMKKVMIASLVSSSIFLLFGAISTAMAIRIQTQKEKIEKQSEEIEMQYQEALRNHSKNLAEESAELLKRGDHIEALNTALMAFENPEEGVSIPWTAEAEFSLASSTYLYRNGSDMSSFYQFKHDTNVCFMKPSFDKKRLLSADQSGGVYVWDVESGKKLLHFQTDTVQNEKICCFLSNNLIAYHKNNMLEIYDIKTEKVVFQNKEITSVLSVSQDGKYFALGTSLGYQQDAILIYDLKTFREICKYSFSEEYSVGPILKFDETSRYLSFVSSPSVFSEKTDTSIMILDLSDGSIVMEQLVDFSYISVMNWENDSLYVGINESLDDRFPDGEYDYTASLDSMILKINVEQRRVVESRENKGKMIADLLLSPEYNHVMAIYYSDSALLDMNNLEFIEGFSFGSQIVHGERLKDSDLYSFLIRKGEYHVISGESLQQLNYGDYFSTGISNFRDYDFAGEGIVILSYQSKDIVYYGKIQGRDWKELLQMEESVSDLVVNADETMALIQLFSKNGRVTILLYDLKKHSVINTIKTEGSQVYCGFVKDGKDSFYLGEGEGNLTIYSVQDKGTVLNHYKALSTLDYSDIMQSADREKIIFQQSRGFTILDLTNGEKNEIEYGPLEWGKVSKIKVGPSLNRFAYLDIEKQNLQICDLETKNSIMQIDLLASYVRDYFLLQEDSQILVQYMDQSAQIFDVNTGELLSQLENLEIDIKKVDFTNEELALIGNSKGYLARENGKIIAEIDGLKCVLMDSKKVLATSGKKLYECPKYSTDELVDLGKELQNMYEN